ncbi:MAG: peptidoglycan editing factor PgeF [Candidatus Aureabacteria bacterium]|nr:peptidoglycan editing factor PgeF [Candidatus Auribacterota bacterium]
MNQKTIDSITLFSFENLSKYSYLTNFTSSKNGGFSPNPYASLNLSYNVNDNKAFVRKNRKKLSRITSIPFKNFIFCEQVHGSKVTVIDKNELEKQKTKEYILNGADAMVTDIPEICLIILTADCVPVILFDPKKKVIAALHAGWKGTVQLITQKTVNAMEKRYGSKTENIIACIGPSICASCYEVGVDVIKKIKDSCSLNSEILEDRIIKNKRYLDLCKANKEQLIFSGINENNIEESHLCTSCSNNIFYSYRKQKGKTGRFATGIMLNQS